MKAGLAKEILFKPSSHITLSLIRKESQESSIIGKRGAGDKPG
jgi:hypothetical protein